MPKLDQAEANAPTPPMQHVAEPDTVHPQDRVHSGMFGSGRVVELLKNAEGYAYGHRILFENGMEAQLLITELPIRH